MGRCTNVQWGSIEAEARGVAAFVAKRIADGISAGECLILAPRRAIGYAIRDALSDLGHAAETYFREQPVQTRQAQEVLSLLTLLIDPLDRVAQRAWLGFGSDDWRKSAYRRLWEAADQGGVSVFEVLALVSAGDLTVPYSANLVSRWEEFRERQRVLGPLLDDLQQLVDTLLPAEEPDLALLRELALSVLGEAGGDERQFLALVRAGVAQPEVPLEATKVRIMSFHRSKGLTADLVVLAGLVEGLMPQAIDRRDLPPPKRQ